ncbi:MAG: Mut7-C RNAse domain-containing protein, partial [Myxococcales bacterium]
ATFRFYAELNDQLPRELRQVDVVRRFTGAPAVKDAIEAIGIPHTEVDLILVDGEPVGFEEPLRDGARVSVYPVFEAMDVAPFARLRPEPLRQPRFVLDVHLGRLARLMRLGGLDVHFSPDHDDEALAAISRDERRTLLTRDRGLLKRSAVTHGYWVRETHAERQLVEVLRRFDLVRLLRPFTRCAVCNERLNPVPKETVGAELPERVRARFDAFLRCEGCARVYWAGTHHARIGCVLARAARQATTADGAGPDAR